MHGAKVKISGVYLCMDLLVFRSARNKVNIWKKLSNKSREGCLALDNQKTDLVQLQAWI
jgi:hypothetical protein